jgi:hypothetical protein
MREAESEYIACVESLWGDVEGRARAHAYMADSPAVFHGLPTAINFIPKIYDRAQIAFFEDVVAQTNAIISKVIDRYAADASYRALFGFEPELERLVLIDPGYSCKVPFGRYDIFFDEGAGSFKFCELNTDGSAAMLRDWEGTRALSHAESHRVMAARLGLEPQDMFAPLVSALLDMYVGEVDPSNPTPRVGIVDFRESANVAELEHFVGAFAEAGICADLIFVDELPDRMRGARKPDVIYRRAVTLEVMEALVGRMGAENGRGAKTLISAYEAGDVCLMGGFRTQVAHCKQIFRVLHHEMTKAFLKEGESAFIDAHVPYTALLDGSLLEERDVRNTREAWIIKPPDGYSGHGVYAGRDMDASEWARLIDMHRDTGYVIQEYCEQVSMLNMGTEPDARLEPWNILTGLFSYGDKLGGVYIRTGQTSVIVDTNGSRCAPVFVASKESI